MSTYRGPINTDPGPGEASIIIYGYVPSLALGVVGAVAFFLVLLANAWYALSQRGYRSFHTLLLVGCAMELGGYVARIYAHYHPFLVSAFVAQYFLIVVAPVLFSAAIYLTLTLVVRGFEGSDAILLVKPRTVLICFVTFDAICTVIQVAGAALIGKSESAKVQGTPFNVTPEQANDILLAGLAIQTFSFLTFLSVLSVALYRARRPRYMPHVALDSQRRLPITLWVILITSDLILLRTIFRLAETAQGFFGFASTHEALFGTLEFLPVILAIIIWSVYPPHKLIGPGGGPSGKTPFPAGSSPEAKVDAWRARGGGGDHGGVAGESLV